jgi:hypothetical protein
VSNSIVVRLLRKSLLFVAIGISVVLVFALIAGQVEQRVFRRRATLLLTEIQSLKLGTTPWHEAQGQFEHWGTNEKHNDQCNEQQCSLEITLIEPVYNFIWTNRVFVNLDDYLRWRLKLTYDTGPFVRLEVALLRAYLVMGGRPAKVIAKVGMLGGTVWSKGFQTSIEAQWYVDEFTELISNVESISYQRDPQLALHPDYVIDRQSGCCADVGYVRFTPQADPNDVHRLMQFDLSCLTRIRPCLDQSDIMPVAWKQYLAEHSIN